MKLATYQCQSCNKDFAARPVDRARGWARFCSKSCKGIRQKQNGGTLPRKAKHVAANKTRAANRNAGMTEVQKLRARAAGAARAQGVDIRTWLEYRHTYGGNPQFDRRGNYEGFSARFSEEVEYDEFEDLYRDMNIDKVDDGGHL
jgi:hypothetical protein